MAEIKVGQRYLNINNGQIDRILHVSKDRVIYHIETRYLSGYRGHFSKTDYQLLISEGTLIHLELLESPVFQAVSKLK
jgi:hypothetical protein